MIQYNVVENVLTNPPSFTCRPVAVTVLGADQIAALINTRLPDITPALVTECLEIFRQVVLEQTASGNAITLHNFMSLGVSIAGRYELATGTPSTADLRSSFFISKVLVAEVLGIASFSRLGVITKEPSIVSASDSNTGLANWLRSGATLDLKGENLNFDNTDESQGIFLTSPAGETYRVDNIPLTTAKNVLVLPTIDADEGPAGKASVDYGLQLKAKYSPFGMLKTASFDQLRKTNVIDVDNDGVFTRGSATTAPAIITAYTGENVTARIVARLRPDNALVISAGLLTAALGQETVITGNGTYSIAGLEGLEIEITDFDRLKNNVVFYKRYLQEVVQMSGENVPIFNFAEYTRIGIRGLAYIDVATELGYYIALGEVFSLLEQVWKLFIVSTNDPLFMNWTSFSYNITTKDNYGFGKVAISAETGTALISDKRTETWLRSSGTNYTSWTTKNLPTSQQIYPICFGAGVFVAYCYNETSPYSILKSTDDGETFVGVHSSSKAFWKALAFGDGKFVGVTGDDTGSTTRFSLSYNPTTGDTLVQNMITLDHPYGYKGIAFGDGKFVACANGTKFAMLDETGWHEVTVPNGAWMDIKYLDGKWTAVSADSTNNSVIESTNLSTWEYADVPFSADCTLRTLALSEENCGIILANNVENNEISTYGYVNIDWDTIQIIAAATPTQVTFDGTNSEFFKVMVPEGATAYTIRLDELTGEADLYLGEGFLPHWRFNSQASENSGTDAEEISGATSAGEILVINALGYEPGTGVLEVTFS